ncbi:MAG: CinA family protein [Betaproteobacteria bacterium]|nr:CinA family protein [Betaproteobacteria bacterium]
MRGADVSAGPAWQDLVGSAVALRGSLLGRGWMLGCAESCTGGLVAAAVTSIAGSSEWFERGFVTYSNQSKTELLGVPEVLLVAHGAVSREVALAMAQGVLARAPVQAALAVTGIAGPGGGSPDKPVGLVWFGWAWRQGQAVHGEAESVVWPGDRQAVRMAAAHHAVAGLQLRLAALKP